MAARILIVEDHPTMREAMRLVLDGQGYTIDEAGDGGTALERIRSDRPDLVFLDLHIPGLDGPQVLRAIRDDVDTRDVHVIVVTATGEEGKADALALGADGYVTKPFSPVELLETVRAALAHPTAPPEG
ncbi:MAG TPA: response regulator [Actinomycetota bacterium]|nr:response regulator [Actinomycetota bacterium]